MGDCILGTHSPFMFDNYVHQSFKNVPIMRTKIGDNSTKRRTMQLLKCILRAPFEMFFCCTCVRAEEDYCAASDAPLHKSGLLSLLYI